MPDVDIDLADRSKILDIVRHVPAVLEDGRRHNTGVYFQNIPVNPLSGGSSLDYHTAENRGYFKIDFLNASIYQGIRDEDHLVELMNKEPLWELLEQPEFVDLLFHLNGHSHIVQKLRPRTVEQLAAVLAIIRPAKRYLLNKTWPEIFAEVWTKPDTKEYYFKHSHATAYAVAVVVQMNLICEQVSYGYS